MVEPLWLKSRVGPKGQAVIPKPIRDRLQVRPGDAVVFGVEDDHIVIRKEKDASLDAWKEFVTSLPKRKMPTKIDWDEMYEERLR